MTTVLDASSIEVAESDVAENTPTDQEPTSSTAELARLLAQAYVDAPLFV